MPINQQNNSTPLSGRSLDQLERYAQAQGITVDEAATQLASQSLRMRYARKTQPAQVLPLRRHR